MVKYDDRFSGYQVPAGIHAPNPLGDGSVHRFGAGHVTLAEALTGKGHTTRAVGSRPRVTATLDLADA